MKYTYQHVINQQYHSAGNYVQTDWLERIHDGDKVTWQIRTDYRRNVISEKGHISTVPVRNDEIEIIGRQRAGDILEARGLPYPELNS